MGIRIKAEVVEIHQPFPGRTPDHRMTPCRGPPRKSKQCKQAALDSIDPEIDLHLHNTPTPTPTPPAHLRPCSHPLDKAAIQLATHINGKQPHPNKLPSPLLPITLRPAPSAPQRSALPLLHDRYLALHLILDASLLRRITSRRRGLCRSNTLPKLERYLVGAVSLQPCCGFGGIDRW